MRMLLHWDERSTEVPVPPVDELDVHLDRLAQEASTTGTPLLVRVYDGDDPAGPMLTVGVGGSRSTIGWTDRDGISWMSRGDVCDVQPITRFLYSGHVSEIPALALVSNEDARDAARRFLKSRDRPDNVDWDTV